MMKRLKLLILFFGLLFIVLRISILVFRLPSYTISTSGKLYIVSKLSEDVQVIDLSTGKEIAETSIDMLSHEAIATTDGKNIVLTNYGSEVDFDLKIIDTKTNKVKKTIDLKDNTKVNGIVQYPEANKVAVVDYVNNKLLVLNIETEEIEKELETNQKKSHLAVLHPKKPLAYTTNINSGSVSVINLNTDKVIETVSCGIGRKGIDITPDGSEIWVTNTKENVIKVINTKTNTVVNTITSGNESLKIKFSVDGKYCLVVNSTDGSIDIFNQQSKEKIKTIMLHGKTTLLEKLLYHTPRPVNILMHPNGLYAFVSNSNANKIEVIDMNTFKIVSTIGTGDVPDALVFVE
ncbi:YncE family protein [Polaribacter sp. R77954]|uniref:YncE family protein n=1 Tax=Polaribacter sp. R77954 TaxID=3093870 RepID=UPI0037CCB80E